MSEDKPLARTASSVVREKRIRFELDDGSGSRSADSQEIARAHGVEAVAMGNKHLVENYMIMKDEQVMLLLRLHIDHIRAVFSTTCQARVMQAMPGMLGATKVFLFKEFPRLYHCDLCGDDMACGYVMGTRAGTTLIEESTVCVKCRVNLFRLAFVLEVSEHLCSLRLSYASLAERANRGSERASQELAARLDRRRHVTHEFANKLTDIDRLKNMKSDAIEREMEFRDWT